VRCLVLLCALTLPAADLPRGEIVDTVACTRASTQTYALYIPTTYSPQHPAPIVYCFDPAARGRLCVEQFKEAAQSHGYIVAASNNSRNGSFDQSLAAARAMMEDSAARLALNPKRLYAAGFSGGARVAATLGLGGFPIAGVILSGAGFPALKTVPAEVPFAVFATAGSEDFNYNEIRALHRTLTTPHRTVIFPGGHEWAPPEVLTTALDWLDLQAVRANLLPKDEAAMQQAFASRRDAAVALPPLPRLEELESIQADFEGLLDTGLAPLIRQLRDSREVKAARKEEDLANARETEWFQRVAPLSEQQDVNPYRGELADLRRIAGKTADTPERRMARRLLSGEFIRHIESGQHLLTQKRYPGAAQHFSFAAAIRPDAAGVVYNWARATAFAGDRKAALKLLAQAIEKGFTNAARIDQDEAFAAYHDLPAYQSLIAPLRKPGTSR
jgi:predicted esterase